MSGHGGSHRQSSLPPDMAAAGPRETMPAGGPPPSAFGRAPLLKQRRREASDVGALFPSGFVRPAARISGGADAGWRLWSV